LWKPHPVAKFELDWIWFRDVINHTFQNFWHKISLFLSNLTKQGTEIFLKMFLLQSLHTKFLTTSIQIQFNFPKTRFISIKPNNHPSKKAHFPYFLTTEDIKVFHAKISAEMCLKIPCMHITTHNLNE